jgi:hypothetical protein
MSTAQGREHRGRKDAPWSHRMIAPAETVSAREHYRLPRPVARPDAPAHARVAWILRTACSSARSASTGAMLDGRGGVSEPSPSPPPFHGRHRADPIRGAPGRARGPSQSPAWARVLLSDDLSGPCGRLRVDGSCITPHIIRRGPKVKQWQV